MKKERNVVQTYAPSVGQTVGIEAPMVNSFVGCVEGITFGVSADGKLFDTANVKWPVEEKIVWAFANAQFFEKVALNLRMFGEALVKHTNTK